MAEPSNKGPTEQLRNHAAEASKAAVEGILRYRRILIVFAHILSFSLSLLLSFLLIHNMRFGEWARYQYPLLLAAILPIKLIIFGIFKQYRGWWRYVGISDLLGIARASLISTLIIVLSWFALMQFEDIRFGIPEQFQNITLTSQGVFLLDLFLTIMVLSGLRLFIRLYHEEFRSERGTALKRLVIAGAGDAGEALLREIIRMRVEEYEVVGFLDDDPVKQGMSIHGVTVLGPIDKLPQIVEEYGVDEVAIAMPSATRGQLRHVVQICQGSKIRFRTVPSITDIASGKLRVSQIRDVDINDLLGRDVVELDLNMIEEFLKNKVILVTGAGGSIGSEMCRQVCKFGPKLLLLVEQAENPLFFIERELRSAHRDVPMESLICNITNKDRVDSLFEKYHPQVVIHAAAHKHVPLMENNPGEAVRNNVIGTMNISSAADQFEADNFVMISTDKAVNPTSIMGSSKRVAEMYIQDLNRTSKTHFVTVRFGNVLGSNGSVVPIFKKQIAAGGPVTVTHPEMRRYFMTIPEASQLVLQAATMGNGGEIFVLDMGEPVKIVDLAKELITLSGFRPGEDIEIEFTGCRPGEKLFEELSIAGEDMQPTRHPKIGIWKNLVKDRQTLHAEIEKLIETSYTQNHQQIVACIKQLIPEYIGDKNNHEAPATESKAKTA